MVQFEVALDRMALVNVDLQSCFVEGSAPNGLAVLDRVNRLAGVYRTVGIPVFHVRHALPSGADPGVELTPSVAAAFPVYCSMPRTRKGRDVSGSVGGILSTVGEDVV